MTGHLTKRTDAGRLPPVTVNLSGSTPVAADADSDNPPATFLQLTVTS